MDYSDEIKFLSKLKIVPVLNLEYHLQIITREEIAERGFELSAVLHNEAKETTMVSFIDFLEQYRIDKKLIIRHEFTRFLAIETIVKKLTVENYIGILIYTFKHRKNSHAELITVKNGNFNMNGLEVSDETFIKKVYSDDENLVFFFKK
jgi:hypothetical protein